MSFHTNPQLNLAFDYVRNTHKNIFLTGKAGTGKTTFLHQIKHESLKRMVVVAPTGVAAINAGGMTIHSFFQLPFGPYLPGSNQDPSRKRNFSTEKRRLIQSLDLLVIDEISMVRADVLDAIDDVLRRYRDRTRPFGGVQLLMIGDLHQLPPVVKDEEWNLLREHYQTAYFFGSQALRNTEPVSIELKHIYRQSDTSFIDLLNKVRDNKMDESVLNMLNSRFVANFQPKPEEPYITLTAHNAAAQEINMEQLARIKEPLKSFKATVQGDFPVFAFPADEVFECKLGAQVMFLKNDISREKRFYNGKIGKIESFDDKTILVRCPGEKDLIEVVPVEWTNVKYALNEQNKEVTEEIVGTFTQYPLKLAWAITIHKSQGLTFERAIIDAQAAFAHGQVYVALSRCKSFEGIVLRSKIAFSSVKTDYVVKNYTEEADKNAPNEAHLVRSKAEFQQNLIRELFDFSRLHRLFQMVKRLFLEHENTITGNFEEKFQNLENQASEQIFGLAERFKPQIAQYFAQGGLPEENTALQERIQKAGIFFEEKLGKSLFPDSQNIPVLTDNKSVKKAMVEAMDALQKEIFTKNACFVAVQEGFLANRYLRAKTDAELDFAKTKVNQAPPSHANVPSDILHPKLFNLLRKWREDMAEEYGLELYGVLPTRSLVEIVKFLPATPAALKKIKGIGSVKLQRFGDQLIAIVKEYCEERHIDTNNIPEPPAEPEKPPKVESKKLTLDMFQAGNSIEDIAKERGLAPSTVEGHLAHYVGLGELDIAIFLQAEAVAEIEAFFREKNTRSTAEAKAHFGEKYTYGQLRLALLSLGDSFEPN